VWVGVDVGLTDSPTVITMWAEARLREEAPPSARASLHPGALPHDAAAPGALRDRLASRAAAARVGIDITGLGFPMWQEMEDDEVAPPHLLAVAEGYMFNAKVPVGVDPSLVSETDGVMRDHYGNMVKVEEDPITGAKRYIVMMPFIAASTRFMREDIDSGFTLLPFDGEVIGDILAETKDRVDKIGNAQGIPRKGDRSTFWTRPVPRTCGCAAMRSPRRLRPRHGARSWTSPSEMADEPLASATMICPATGQPHRESDYRVGGSTICLDCRMKVTGCCEGSPAPMILPPTRSMTDSQRSASPSSPDQ
jgi:hypothetical protein